MSSERHIRLAELLILAVVLALLLVMVLPLCRRRAAPLVPGIRCGWDLVQLCTGLWVYKQQYGDDCFFPFPLGRGRDPDDFSGAEWLASLYWTGVITDPGIFVCPNSADPHDDGKQLGSSRATAGFGSRTVSYAGLHFRSYTGVDAKPRPAMLSDQQPNQVLASDDTEGSMNHGEADNGGMNVLFFDGRVVWKTADELDPRTAVGQKGGLLEKLRN